MNEALYEKIALLEARIDQLTGGAAPLVQEPVNYTTQAEIDRLKDRFVEEIQNFGPIQPLIEDDSVNDILINKHDRVYVERNGKLEETGITFPSDSEVIDIAQMIVDAVGRHLDPARPLVDARLLDGSRVNIIAPPLAVDGTAISIRKFSKRVISLDAMKEQGNVSPQLGEFLKVVGRSRLNVIISGGTGSGKTTLLNAVSQYVEDTERVVTIEDAAELKLQQPHIVRLETKPVSFDKGVRQDEVSIRDLVKNALRMRPDRIIVGEVRGAEAFDMMQAMNTGHEGSLSTIHANHPRDCLARLENMINMANLNLPYSSIRQQISSAINLIIQISRMRDGHRRVTYVSEIIGMEGDVITMQDIFNYNPKGEGQDGKLIGEFQWTGIMPRFVRRAAYYGEAERLASCLGVKLPRL
jgi:pilus assembly protein CpaF